MPRHRLLPLALDHFDRRPERAGTLVHVGSGPVDARYLRRAGAVRSFRVDLDPLDSDVTGDLAALPLRAGAVDLAVAWHVFEHIPDDLRAAGDLRRALAPGGAAVVSVPLHPPDREVTVDGDPAATPEERLARHGEADHARSCGRDYGARLASVGFDLVTLRAGDLPAADVKRFGLYPDHLAWCLTPTAA
jgi:SAM-dependent methyltransferase